MVDVTVAVNLCQCLVKKHFHVDMVQRQIKKTMCSVLFHIKNKNLLISKK